jgi:hypothetical protein
MTIFNSSPKFMSAFGAAAVLVAFIGGCDIGGKAGDRCNPLVLQDECNSGLHCTVATCSEAYCCPTNGSSTDPHCNATGCPDTDAGDDGGADAADASDGARGDASDGGSEAGADAAGDGASDASGGD